jgi:hypothetical protein
MEKLSNMVEEMDEALHRADVLKNDITRVIIDEGHTDLLTVNWRRLREMMRGEKQRMR